MAVKRIRIGTRGSPLALKQTEIVSEALARVRPDVETDVTVIQTTGDWKPEDGETRLNEEAGGKGQFAKEIEAALLAGAIDAAVHSMKDMESRLPDGLIIPCMLPREDPRDSLIINKLANNSQNMNDLPEKATVGTASVRRQAFLLSQRPDLKIVPLRGNVQTRIEKLRSGQVDATLLAYAGLKRLGLEDEADIILEPEDMLPAAGQGAVGVEIRADDLDVQEVFDHISCAKTVLCVSAERAALETLDGSCHTPIGAYALLEGETMFLRVKVAALDGSESYDEDIRQTISSVADAVALGREIGQRLKERLPSGLLAQKAVA